MSKIFFFLFPAIAVFGALPPPSHFVWSKGFMIGADVKPDKIFQDHFPRERYKKINRGDVVWIRTGWIPSFVKHTLPHISKPFILVSGDDDDGPFRYPKETTLLLKSKYLVQWFAQNLEQETDKLKFLPIGLDFHTIMRNPTSFDEEDCKSSVEQQQELITLLSTLAPTTQRIPKIHYDAHLVNRNHPRLVALYGDTRGGVAEILRSKGEEIIAIQEERMPQHLYFAEKGRYMFSTVLYGQGLDCHRTWENLVLGHIVIMKSTALDPLFQGLPVILIQNWDAINEENLVRWREEYGDVFHNKEMRERLTHRYWMEKIRSAKKLCK